jgi:3-phosphoshikimate 1-carboxyvinyltransferase
MPLPELIEIAPLESVVHAQVTVPGSKSVTNRALVLAVLAEGETVLRDALWSDDTQVMVEALQRLGFSLRVDPDPHEQCNRTITVHGRGGRIPRGGSEHQPLSLYVENAGTAARFLAALVCLGEGVYRLHGTTRMHERPQAALFQALRQLGYRVDSANDRLPAVIYGAGPRPATCQVSIEASSQFASALLLCRRIGQWDVAVIGENPDESPYVTMTAQLLEVFPRTGGIYRIEPDASSGSYFWAAGYLEWLATQNQRAPMENAAVTTWQVSLPIVVRHWPQSTWQIDEQFPSFLETVESCTERYAVQAMRLTPDKAKAVFDELRKTDPLLVNVSRSRHLGDSIMTAIAMAPLLAEPIRFTNLARLRLQECDRVTALRTELAKCGARIVERGDTLEVFPSRLHGAEIDTYQDHRMAMCFATLGLRIPNLRIRNPSCVRKTFPNFFQKLAEPPPTGLGAAVLHGVTGRPLRGEGLVAGGGTI